MKNYIVTLKDIKDKEKFCDEMSSKGSSNVNVPMRICKVINQIDTERNIVFELSEEEANKLKSDPRIIDVDLPAKERGYRLVTQIYRENPEIIHGYEKILDNKKDQVSAQAVFSDKFSII